MSKLICRMKAVAAITALLAVTGCSAVYRNHGYAPSDDDLSEVLVGVSTQADVADTVGRPSAFGVLADSGWYYARSRWRHYAYKAPEEVDRQLVAISFDNDGVVENIERFTLEDGRVVALSRRVTSSNIKGITFLRQLLGNLGNIDAGSFLGNN